MRRVSMAARVRSWLLFRVVSVSVLLLIGCGRVAFDAAPDASGDGSGSSAVCADPTSTAACDDGDPCTVDDRCVAGVCGSGPATGCSTSTREIYRSAGADLGALASATGTVTINGTTASFSQDLPLRVGVGDVIEYDANGDGSLDGLAFIHSRLSGSVFSIRNATGDTPVATLSAASTWNVFRAYGSLAAVVDRSVGGTRNPSITASTFDTYTGGRDLVAADERLHVALYNDGLDTASVAICNTSYTRSCAAGESWTTDATHYLHIFTPVTPAEVGTSQRHAGTFTTGYRRTQGIIMYQGHVRLDGLSLLRDVNGNGRSYYVETQGAGGEVWISNSLGRNTITGASKVYDIWDTGVAALGPTYTVFKLWNDIAVNESATDTRSGFYINSNRAEAYLYNCTSYAIGGGAYAQSSQSRATIRNSIAVSTMNAAFSTNDGFQLVASSVSNDTSINALANGMNNLAGSAIDFRDVTSRDLHLAGTSIKLIGTGLDLSADPTIPFSNDIDGDPRSAGAWDIGADQFVP